MEHDYYKLVISVFDFENYYSGDFDNCYMISLFETFGYEIIYYNPLKYTKEEIKEMAEKQLEELTLKSNIELYLHGSNGKYIITPSNNYFPVDFLYKINEDDVYEREAPFMLEMFNNLIPTDLLKKSLINLGAIELFEELTDVIKPVEKYYVDETELSKLDKEKPKFELRFCMRENDGALIIKPFNTLERALAKIEYAEGYYSIIRNLKTGEVVFQDKTEK